MTRTFHADAARPAPCGGFYFCPHCHAPADLEDPGEAYPLCARCGHRGLQWCVEEAPTQARQAPRRVEPPATARMIEHTPRLPADKRDLRRCFGEGFLFCAACEHVTERNGAGNCRLCGSDLVQEVPPIDWQEDAA